MSNKPKALIVENITKHFRIYREKEVNLKYILLKALRGKRSAYEDFYALKSVSFSVDKGETLGIIGENGSGKSSLLKIIAGIFAPDGGKLCVNGKVCALLELGAGFHHELTGRENIYLNSAVLGFKKKDIDKKIDDIISFAELERFIDMPIKSYSSGMYMRLGFAIAVNVQPDILLIDEIMAVGDEAFQLKCKQKMREFQEQKKTIILVSHDMGLVREMCHRALLLHQGEVVFEGSPAETVNAYHNLMEKVPLIPPTDISPSYPAPTEIAPAFDDKLFDRSSPKRFGNMDAVITSVKLAGARKKQGNCFQIGEPFRIEIDYFLKKEIPPPVIGIGIYTESGLYLAGPNTYLDGIQIDGSKKRGKIHYLLNSLPFHQGNYHLSVAIYDQTITIPLDHHHKLYSFQIVDPQNSKRYGLIDLKGRWIIE